MLGLLYIYVICSYFYVNTFFSVGRCHVSCIDKSKQRTFSCQVARIFIHQERAGQVLITEQIP